MKFSRTVQRLLGLLAPYKARIIVAFIATAITAATEPTVAALMKELLDNGFVRAGFPIWLAPAFGHFSGARDSDFLCCIPNGMGVGSHGRPVTPADVQSLASGADWIPR
jgi:hypothetical protein